MNKPTVHIIGAGVAGLSAALELVRRDLARPILIDSAPDSGGLVRPYPHGSGVVDVGGHRFHTRSPRVEQLWRSVMPIGPRGLLRKQRTSLLYFEDTFFPYPLAVTPQNLLRFGIRRSARAAGSYLRRPRSRPQTLREFFVTTYGAELSELFFESYTLKVWGRPASEIRSTWGPERLKSPALRASGPENFFYPHGGPALFWQRVRDEVLARGGELWSNTAVLATHRQGNRITELVTTRGRHPVQQLFSTIPLSRLAGLLRGPLSEELPFRGLVSVHLSYPQGALHLPSLPGPQWIYLHDPALRAGRVQNYRAWDPSLLGEEGEILGVEFFADPTDDLWSWDDEQLVRLAEQELHQLKIVPPGTTTALGTVVRLRHAYPCHWRSTNVGPLQQLVDGVENLYSFGRQGLHRYLNMDLTTLSALRAVDLLESGEDKKKLWDDFPGLHHPE